MSKLKDDISSAVGSVAKDWKKAKQKEARVSSRSLGRMRYYAPPRQTVKNAAFQVMREAIAKASGNGRYLANARQIMYAARPMVLEITGGECWKDSAYFTQTILKEYIEYHGGAERIVWDARGNLHEPHTNKSIPLGGADVAEYCRGWTNGRIDVFEMQAPKRKIDTTGPHYRYSGVLFIEKEGFHEILEDAGIAEKYDLALMSTKGIPVEAASRLLQSFDPSIKIFVLHDFDLAGFKILKTLKQGTRLNYGYTSVIDLGFRIGDVDGVESEPVTYKQRSDPRDYLRRCEATPEERNFLVKSGNWRGWYGERVELNAMTSDQLIEWLVGKLEANGAEKVIPESETLVDAYKRAAFLANIDRKIESLKEELESQPVEIPTDLEERVKDMLAEDDRLSWDEAVYRLAQGNQAPEDNE